MLHTFSFLAYLLGDGQFAPMRCSNLNAIVSRCLFDVGESFITISICDTLDLVEASQGISDMSGVRQRLLPLPLERIHAVRQVILLLGSCLLYTSQNDERIAATQFHR